MRKVIERISLADLEFRLRERSVRLPIEISLFVSFRVCEELLSEDPNQRIDLSTIFLTEKGEISIETQFLRIVGKSVNNSLTDVLARLLVLTGNRISERNLDLIDIGNNDPSLRTLRNELEARLLPLNRGASMRTLARIYRDVHAPTDDFVETENDDEANQNLDAFLDLTTTSGDLATVDGIAAEATIRSITLNGHKAETAPMVKKRSLFRSILPW